MSIITGLLDWRFAAQKGKNPREQRFMPWAAGVATDLAKEAIKNSGPIGLGQSDALRTLLNLMMMAVQLGNQLGHMRVQQGSEHYLAQVLGAESAQGVAYAELVGPCLLFAAALHGQDPAPLRDALQHAGVRLDQLRATDFNLMIDNLDGHLTEYGFPYSVLNEVDPQSEAVAKALEAAGLAILADTWKKLEEAQPLSAALETPVEAAPSEAAAEEPAAVEAAPAEAEVETAPVAAVEAAPLAEVETTPQGDIETQPAAAIADVAVEMPPADTQAADGPAGLSHG
jgi:glycerol dehydrogenase-like iron-containing ADH family enzyme